MGKDFSVSDTKTSEKKPKNGQISLYQVTEFCLFVFTVKETIRMVKRQLTDWKRNLKVIPWPVDWYT